MSRVKYFINSREPGATDLAEQMREGGIDLACIPTSGPSVLWIEGYAHYGTTAVKFAVESLTELEKILAVTNEPQSEESDDLPG